MCGPNLLDTTTSVTLQDIALHDLYNLKSAEIRSSLSYDCNVFDKTSNCFSFAGRAIDLSNNDGHAVDGSLIVSHQITPQFSAGGYLGMGMQHEAGNGITDNNDIPKIGLFGDWAVRPDGTGVSLHVAGTYDTSSVDIQRARIPATGPLNSEAGRGETTLQARGASAVFSYGVPLNQWFAAPYAGLQESVITRGGYTEVGGPGGVLDPLTYKTLTDRQTTALLGVKLHHPLSQVLTLNLTGGLEHDLSHDISHNVATSILGTSDANFGATYRQTRGVASAGLGFAVAPLQTVTATVGFRQEALGAANTLTGIVAYQIGF